MSFPTNDGKMAGENDLLSSLLPVLSRNIVLIKQFVMQQPELGIQLIALRKERNLTQEELVEKSHVSVRTIQRIEAGEVLPRMSTVKILLEALGEDYESFLTKQNMETQNELNTQRNTLLLAALAGAVYLVCQIILGAMDISWFTDGHDWSFQTNAIFISLTVVMVISYALFVWGFVVLSKIFENSLLKIIVYILIVANASIGILDVATLSVNDTELLILPYASASILFGTLSIVFGVALLRLQDSMGQLSRIAGIMEIVMGCLLITVVLFFIAFVIMIPAVLIEILVLWRGYEYLSKTTPAQVSTL
ncbi:MAG: helix-turn-helix transcriptional regulator [Cyclobacteriaceae bacterium]